ncbi:MAG: type III-A CRISPR-associated protein Csm2 [Ignavibacteriaceae bacterium]
MITVNKFNSTLDSKDKLSELDTALVIDFAHDFVENYLVNNGKAKIKSHQLRRFFNAIKGVKLKVDQIGNFTEKERIKVIMLRPQLINASAKEPTLNELELVCNKMIKKIKDKDDFYLFSNFFESIVAFHKPYDK